MKIGICGTHSTGKTTLLNALRGEDFFIDGEYAICDESTRYVKSLDLPINEDARDVTQLMIMFMHLQNITLYPNMLTDRTSIDCLMYTIHQNQSCYMVSAPTVSHCHVLNSYISKQYDLIFYLKPEFDLVADGTRSTSQKFRNDIADMFEHYVHSEASHEVVAKIVPITGSVSNRITQAMDAINLKVANG